MLNIDDNLIHMAIQEGLKHTIKKLRTAFGIGNDFITEEMITQQMRKLDDSLNSIQESLSNIENKLDANTLGVLTAGFKLLKDANCMTNGKELAITNALSHFHVIASLPGGRKTGGYMNDYLKFLAFLGCAIGHDSLGSNQELVAKYILNGYIACPVVAEVMLFPTLKNISANWLLQQSKFIFHPGDGGRGKIIFCYVFNEDVLLKDIYSLRRILVKSQDTSYCIVYPGYYNLILGFNKETSNKLDTSNSWAIKHSEPLYVKAEPGMEYHFYVNVKDKMTRGSGFFRETYSGLVINLQKSCPYDISTPPGIPIKELPKDR